jgi:hypothetical protein
MNYNGIPMVTRKPLRAVNALPTPRVQRTMGKRTNTHAAHGDPRANRSARSITWTVLGRAVPSAPWEPLYTGHATWELADDCAWVARKSAEDEGRALETLVVAESADGTPSPIASPTAQGSGVAGSGVASPSLTDGAPLRRSEEPQAPAGQRAERAERAERGGGGQVGACQCGDSLAPLRMCPSDDCGCRCCDKCRESCGGSL